METQWLLVSKIPFTEQPYQTEIPYVGKDLRT